MNYGYPYPTYPQMQPRTNKIFVTSLEDALNRPADPNSEVIYLDQDKPFLYQVMNDMQGRKTYKTFELTEYSGLVTWRTRTVRSDSIGRGKKPNKSARNTPRTLTRPIGTLCSI